MTAVEQLHAEIKKILPEKFISKYETEIAAAAQKAVTEEKNQHFYTWLRSQKAVQDSGHPKSFDSARAAFTKYYDEK